MIGTLYDHVAPPAWAVGGTSIDLGDSSYCIFMRSVIHIHGSPLMNLPNKYTINAYQTEYSWCGVQEEIPEQKSADVSSGSRQ